MIESWWGVFVAVLASFLVWRVGRSFQTKQQRKAQRRRNRTPVLTFELGGRERNLRRWLDYRRED